MGRRHDRLESLEAGGRPQDLRVVVDLESRLRIREPDPGELGSRVDMNVGRDSRRLIESTAANEPDFRTAVLAEDRHLAGRTSENQLLAAVVARHLHGLRRGPEQLHTVALDQQVDDERASGLSLAVQAVTAMREERIGRESVANRSDHKRS